MSAWDTEFAPPSLVSAADAARVAFGLEWSAIGMIGDRDHTYGYHRSRNWVNQLGSSTSDYSNQLAVDRAGGNGDWVSALDISLDPERMKIATGRLINALKARDPRVAAVRECFGTLDGVNVVGWDAAKIQPTTSDDSHLMHVHLSFYRSMAGNDHSDVVQVLTTDGGSSVSDDYGSYGKPAAVGDRTIAVMITDIWGQELSEDSPFAAGSNPSVRSQRLARIEQGIKDARSDIAKLSLGNVDISQLAAALTPIIRTVVAEELAKLTLKAE